MSKVALYFIVLACANVAVCSVFVTATVAQIFSPRVPYVAGAIWVVTAAVGCAVVYRIGAA